MIQRYITLAFTFISIIISTGQTCDAVIEYDFDYESQPYQPFDFQHLDLNLTLDAGQALVSGVATYTVAAKIDGVTEMLLHTSKSAIESVLINEDAADYFVSGDSLLINLPDSSDAGEDFEVEITWQSTSNFGLMKDYKGNFWSSKNPLAHHHWFPVFDHPRVALTVNAIFTLPLETEVMFNGDLIQTLPLSASKKKVYYESTTPVPVTGLGFAQGDFVISEMTAGFTKLRLFSPEFGFSEAERQELVVEAARTKKAVENELSFEYPWQGLNIVVLPDNTWEERTHGAGTIFLYQNLGSLKNQLKRGIYRQWFGEYLRGEQFFNFNGGSDQLLSTALHYLVADTALVIENPDSLFKLEEWNQWQLGFTNETEVFQTTVKQSLKELVRTHKGVVGFHQYAEYWYDKTGIPVFNPSPLVPVISDTAEQGWYQYGVDAYFDEASSELELVFHLMEGSGEELSSLILVDHQFDAVNTHEVLFTGEQDTVRVSLSPATEFITLEDDSYSVENLAYGRFPLYFLLNQLRSEQKRERILAAKLLAYHSENPDLQLALTDVLAFEQDPDVKAAINETMATFTAGAFGTEEKFLNDLKSDSKQVKLASINALVNYLTNELVKNAIRTEVLRNEDYEIFTAALNVYRQMASGDELLSAAKRLQRSDTLGTRVLDVFFSSDSLQNRPESIEIVEEYLSAEFPFSTRKYALRFLEEFDLDQDNWNERIDYLTTDRDPRIRFLGFEDVIKFKTTTDALLYLKSAILDESDPRVLLIIDAIIDDLDE